jgi:hypothetical protein
VDKTTKRDCVVAVLVLPFVVSLCWWVSPWLGVPAMFVGGGLWCGAILVLSDLRKAEQKQA